MMKHVLRSPFILLPATLVLTWLAGLLLFAAFILTMDKPQTTTGDQADAIIVFTGGSKRIETGLTLLKQQQAPVLFISGVGPNLDIDTVYKLWSDDDSAETLCCFELGKKATNTIGNAIETKQWASDNHISSIILVTSDYHMPRAVIELRKEMPALSVSPYVVKGGPDMLKNTHYWRLIFEEYHKTFYSLLQLLFASGNKDV